MPNPTYSKKRKGMVPADLFVKIEMAFYISMPAFVAAAIGLCLIIFNESLLQLGWGLFAIGLVIFFICYYFEFRAIRSCNNELDSGELEIKNEAGSGSLKTEIKM